MPKRYNLFRYCFFTILLSLCLVNLSFGATLFQDNFNYSDSFSNHGWGEVTSESSIAPGAGSDGSNALKISFNADSVNRQHNYGVPANTKELWVKFHFRIQGNAIGGAKFLKFFGIRSGDVYANSTFQMVYQSGLFEQILYGNSGDTRDASTGIRYADSPIDARDNQWHTFKVHMKYNDNGQSNGAYGVWYDGKQQVNVTNINNRSDKDSPYFDYVQLGGWNQYYGGTPYYIYYDNFVVANSDPDGGAVSTVPAAPTGLRAS
jgi:hypothetical protein